MMTRVALPLFAALLAAASPAQADEAKSEAILGGQSKLAAIMAHQSALTPAANGQRGLPIVQAVVRENIDAPRVPVSATRPDIFGSVALPMRASALDARWNAVANDGVGGAAAGYAARVRDLEPIDRLDAINRYVNDHVRFVDDSRAYGVADRWSSPDETLASGRGDCEDYALAKMAMARRAGFADKDLYLVVLKDLVRRADHAVLVVRADDRFLVLDNGTSQLIDSDRIRDYRPLLTFTRGQRFTHGYRRDSATAPMIMASAGRIDTPARPVAQPSYAMAENRPLPVSMFAAPTPAAAPIKR